MQTSNSLNAQPFNFFLLVFVLSILFWVLGFIGPDTTKIIPIGLPLSALMTFCPMIAAVILIYRKQKMLGVKQLLKQVFDFKKIHNKKWYVPIVLLLPIIALLSFWYVKFTRILIPSATFSLLSICILFIAYFIAAIGEELGWSGYIINPMQNKYGALKASIIVGIIWAVWHIIPYYQAHQTTYWIIWQCIGTVFLRIIMVWIFNNAGKSVFAMVLFHTMINISPYLISNYGANYNPFIFCMLLMIVVIIIIYCWDAKTFTKFTKL
jgi:uncharacterized protein